MISKLQKLIIEGEEEILLMEVIMLLIFQIFIPKVTLCKIDFLNSKKVVAYFILFTIYNYAAYMILFFVQCSSFKMLLYVKNIKINREIAKVVFSFKNNEMKK